MSDFKIMQSERLPCLWDYAEKYPDDLVLWISKNTILQLSDLRLFFLNNAHLLKKIHGKNVALGKLDAIHIAFLLPLLDGLVKSILFLPDEQDSENQNALLKLAESDFLFCYQKDLEQKDLEQKNHVCELIDVNQFFSQSGNDGEGKSGSFDRNHETGWLIATSGTTGIPKLIAHTLGSLTRSVNLKSAGDNYIWGSLYGIKRFAGLQVYLQAFLSGSRLILLSLQDSMLALLEVLAKQGCTALSATPTMWRKIVMMPNSDRLTLKQLTLGGEIADQAILTVLRNKFPQAKITHIYASTEAGVGFSVKDGLEGFPASYVLNPVSGVELRVDSDGFLWIRTAGQKQARLANGNGSLADHEGWINTGDLVKKSGDRWVFMGRASGIINVGGNKVVPEIVERVISEVEGVACTVVKPRKSTIMGQLVEALILPHDGVDFAELKVRVQKHCRSFLESYEVPVFISQMTDIGFSSSGKIKRTYYES